MAYGDGFTDYNQSSNSGNAIAPPPPQGPMQDQDFASQYQQILAPYQAKAQQIYGGNPYFGNSQFAQNHPTASHVMGNLLLGLAAYNPGAGPQSVGQGAAQAARMALAPHQYEQQQQLNIAEAPGKMMSPELQLMQHLSQMRFQNSEIQRNQAYSDYMSGARTAQAQATADAKNNPPSKTHFGPVSVDPTNPNQMIQPEYDTATGQFLRTVPYAGTKPANPNQDFTPSGIVRNLQNTKPGTPEHDKALEAANTYSTITSGVAGNIANSRKTGEEGAPHTHEDNAAMITQTHADLYKDIPPVQDRKTFGRQYILGGGDFDKEEENYQKTVVNPHVKSLYDREDQFNAWRTSDAQKGIPFDSKKDYKGGSDKGPSSGGSSSLPPVSQFQPNETKYLKNPNTGKVEKYWHNPQTHQVQKVD